MKKLFSIVLIIAVLCSAAFCLFACDTPNNKSDNTPDNQEVYVDYSKDNSYEFEVTEDDDAVTYMPKGVTAKYGLLFYLGTIIPPECYAYLAEPLARQGYVVVIPKILFAYFLYKETEVAFEKHPNVEFFIGGHSQGGGAAIKRAQENIDTVKGVVLLAPLCSGQETIADTDLPTLLLEATNDGILSASQKQTAKSRLPEDREEHMLTGNHMSFSSNDEGTFLTDGEATDEEKIAQKQQTVEYTLAFMNAVVRGK